MKSSRETETEIRINIQKTLLSINDITLKIKKELEVIKDIVKENGYLHTSVDTANEVLSKKAQEMGMNVTEIISENKNESRLELDLPTSVMSMVITEKLLKYLDS